MIFVFVERPDRAADFYRDVAGWRFDAIGRDKDILFIKDGPAVGIRPADRGPDGASGAVTFHISVADSIPIIDAIESHLGHVGPPVAAGIFCTQACRDDQGTAFSLWYRPAGVRVT